MIEETEMAGKSTFEFSLWTKLPYNPSPQKIPNEERAYLISNPNSVVFFVNPVNTIRPRANFCRFDVDTADVVNLGRRFIFNRTELYFYCSKECCEMQCCELNWTLISSIIGLFCLLMTIFVFVTCRNCTTKKCVRSCMGIFKPNSRRIRRMNARRERVQETRAGSPVERHSIRRSVKRQVSCQDSLYVNQHRDGKECMVTSKSLILTVKRSTSGRSQPHKSKEICKGTAQENEYFPLEVKEDRRSCEYTDVKLTSAVECV